MNSKAEILPYFPLSVFLFPGEDTPLRIFEPRYRQLIEEVRNTGDSFVIPYVIGKEIQEYGCEVRLKEVVGENPGGRMVITVESIALVKIITYNKQLGGKLYAGGAFERLPFSEPIESEELLGIIKSYIDQYDNNFLNCCKHATLNHQDIIKALNLSSEDKYKFISMPDSRQKEGYLTGQIHYLKMIRKQETLLGNDFGLN
ncbi:MAG: LON peptidase substrate-binding domain-containing protein [Bacteroidota bacterium]